MWSFVLSVKIHVDWNDFKRFGLWFPGWQLSRICIYYNVAIKRGFGPLFSLAINDYNPLVITATFLFANKMFCPLNCLARNCCFCGNIFCSLFGAGLFCKTLFWPWWKYKRQCSSLMCYHLMYRYSRILNLPWDTINEYQGASGHMPECNKTCLYWYYQWSCDE